jgi:hypothetical protein
MPTDNPSNANNEVKERDSLRKSSSSPDKVMRALTGTSSTVPKTAVTQWFSKTAADIMRPKTPEKSEEVQSNGRTNELHEKYMRYTDICQRLELSKQISSDIAIKALGLNNKEIVAYPVIIDTTDYNTVIRAIENINQNYLADCIESANNMATEGPEDTKAIWEEYANKLTKISRFKDEGPLNASTLEAVGAFRAITNYCIDNQDSNLVPSWRNLTGQAELRR